MGLDKYRNKHWCACGKESQHGVIDDNNIKIGEFCDNCMADYLEANYPNSLLLSFLRPPIAPPLNTCRAAETQEWMAL